MGNVSARQTSWAILNGDRSADRVRDFSRAIARLRGWRRWAVAFTAGGLSVLAMAPFYLWPVLFFTLPVLVWMIDGASESGGESAIGWRASARRAFEAGWWFGFGYFVFGLFWVGEAFLVEAEKFAWLLPFAVTLLPAGMALFTGLGAATARVAWPQGIARVLVLAVTLSAAEWLRGHVLTGFPWNVLGYALTWPLPMMQSAALFGVYGLTLIAVFVFAGPLIVVADADSGRRREAWVLSALIAFVPLLVLYGYGAWRLSGPVAPMADGVRLRIVQASVAQKDKWRPQMQGQIFTEQLELSRTDPSGRRDDLAGITHLIWPEAAMPFLPLEHPAALKAIGDLLPDGTQLISGALRLKVPQPGEAGGAREGFNSLMVFSDDGQLASVYDKIHLVPFGEYLPMQALLESIGLEQLTRWRGGFNVGPSPRPLLDIDGLPPVAGLICYEAIFPSQIVQGEKRPGLIVNVTNDGWFGDTTGPRQHFHQSRVRAVEEGLPVVRAANNGVSAIIDGYGRIGAALGLNARGVIDSGVPPALSPPLYARIGDWSYAALALLFVICAAMIGRRSCD